MKKHLFFALKLIITLSLLAWVWLYVDIESVWQRIRNIELSLFIYSVFCLISVHLLSGLRWAWIAKGLGIDVSKRRKIRLYYLGVFASLFLPSTIGGDVARAVLLAKGRKGKGWAATASVILDRVNGVYALSLLTSICLLMVSFPESALWAWFLFFIALWSAMLLYPWLHTRLPAFVSAWKGLPLNTPQFRLMWWRSLPISFMLQCLIVQAHVFLGIAVGLEMSWEAYAVMVCLIALAAILPVSLNGFGIREAGYVSFAVYFGGSSDAAAAMSALWIVVLVLTALPGSIILWRLGGSKAIEKSA
ncbi:MAG: lysylphosphatidylglycerol synthase transmembrane domain-containing protein [Mariprofundaceae bacterium]|nr:lysylphosphatidylglycerol synthase transmembrane domain-containing protein [Mariprofundaceae bacterium]